MGRGNPQNLIKNSDRTPEQRREQSRRAGVKSGEARRAKKTMKEMLEYLLTQHIENEQGEIVTTLEEISVSLIRKAMNGDVRAFEVLRDTIGEKPTDTVVAAQANLDVQDKHIIDDVMNKLKQL